MISTVDNETVPQANALPRRPEIDTELDNGTGCCGKGTPRLTQHSRAATSATLVRSATRSSSTPSFTARLCFLDHNDLAMLLRASRSCCELAVALVSPHPQDRHEDTASDAELDFQEVGTDSFVNDSDFDNETTRSSPHITETVPLVSPKDTLQANLRARLRGVTDSRLRQKKLEEVRVAMRATQVHVFKTYGLGPDDMQTLLDQLRDEFA